MKPTPQDFAWLDDAASLLSGAPVDVPLVLNGLLAQRTALLDRHIFYPVATDIDFSALTDFYGKTWNNIGSRTSTPPGGNHTKAAERALLAWSAALFGLPADDWWGNITTGGTAGNRAGLLHARHRFPATGGVTTAVTYYCATAHYSVPKILDELAMPAVRINADRYGEMDYTHLAEQLRPGAPAIVLATAGTTMTEAVDDTTRISEVLDAAGILEHAIHVDAALSGVPLALDGDQRTAGADSISVSAYKFFGVKHIGGLVVGRRAAQRRQRHVSYIAAIDDASSGSIDGLPALMMWYAVATYGNTGHQARAHTARAAAAYATERLNAIGWPAWRHTWAMTVVFAIPPQTILDQWPIAVDHDQHLAHLICMPGVTHHQIDAFVDAMAETTGITRAVCVPAPRSTPETHHDQRWPASDPH